MINKITIVGNLGADPELKTLENGTAVCRLSVATTDNYKDKSGEWQKQTEWHSVVLWRDMAERTGANLKKGNLVYIEGKVTYQKYTDGGVEKYKTDIVANVCRSLERKEQGEQQAQQTEQPKRQEPKYNPIPDGGTLPF